MNLLQIQKGAVTLQSAHGICTQCGVDFIEVKQEADIFDENIIYIKGKCGHSITVDLLQIAKQAQIEAAELAIKDTFYDFTSTDGKKPRGYQVDGIKFVQASGFRCLIADEQGLGKTIQAIGCVKLFREEIGVFCGVTKTTLTHQWYFEFKRWAAEHGLAIQVIKSGKEQALPGMDGYLISWDLLKVEDVWKMADAFGFYPKTFIFDECQAIKNHTSGRAKAALKAASKAEHIIALSGTPIKNNAGEYYTILHMLNSARFPDYTKFITTYCDSYQTQYGWKVGGLRDPDWFHTQTSDFIIRRTRKEAAPEIPEVDRQFFHVELNPEFNKAYAQAQKELEDLYWKEEVENLASDMASKIVIITKMRRICGLSKVPAVIDYVEEFIDNEPDRKLVIFAHHHDVVTLLELKLKQLFDSRKNGIEYQSLNLHSGLNPEKRADLVTQFKDDPTAKVMIASTLAAGEGLNLQFCSRAVMLERQWNPANEEQAEGRFARIGQEDNIIISYMLASETIDEYFTDLVEQKRAIVKSTLDREEYEWDQNSLVKELVEVLVNKGKGRWRL